MLDIFLKRKTQRAFTEKEIPEADVATILEAGCSAPSKQRSYPWRVIALTQSESGIDLKNKLFTDSFINIPIRKHLLTAKAPLLLAWIGIPIPDNRDFNTANSKDSRQIGLSSNVSKLDSKTRYTIRNRAEKDVMVAASFAMMQAESLGYSTAFTSCYIEDTVKTILNLSEEEWPVVFLAVGEADDTGWRKDVIKDNQIIGFSNPRPFPEPPKMTAAELAKII